MRPRYTDTDRYANGYVTASKTNVAATFKRIRAEQKAKSEEDARNAAEAEAKVRDMKKRKTA